MLMAGFAVVGAIRINGTQVAPDRSLLGTVFSDLPRAFPKYIEANRIYN